MLYACGSNGSGQLGLGHLDDLDSFSPVPLKGEVVQIAGGGNHTLVLLADGTVWGSGSSSRGQLPAATVHFVSVDHPQGRKWTHVAAGWEFSVLVDELNQVWTCGNGPKGELASEEASHGLQKVFEFSGLVVDVKSSMAHTLVLLDSGEVYGWGASRKGQIGVFEAKVVVPHRVFENAREIGVGRDFSVVLPRDSGAGAFPVIFGSFRGEPPKFNCRNIVCGWSSVAAVNKDAGTLQITGNNSHGQLDSPLSTAPTKLAAGSEHYIAVDKNRVITWGWGEHGNCPATVFIEGCVNVFAGCATTFYYVSDTSYQ